MEREIQRGGECKRQQPPLLPEGAWAQWGNKAVYFVSSIWESEVWEYGVYAINPTDASSVYFVVGFPRRTGARIRIDDASCAILGSRVYVAAFNKMWFYDIGGGVAPKLNEGRNINGSRGCNPYLFTLNGYLYALSLVLKPRREFNHHFQVHIKRGWVSLADPLTLCTTKVESDTLFHHALLAISCIGDSKVILHLSTTHYVACYRKDPLFYKQHFLCYTLKHGYVGEWTRINLDCIDSTVRTNTSYLSPLSCRSHLLSDDTLLLTTPDGKLRAFGLSGLHLEHLDSNLLDLNDKLPHDIKNLLLVQVSQRRYHVIAFSKSANFSVFTFELIYSAPSLCAEIISTAADHHWSGTELPLPLGIAYSSS